MPVNELVRALREALGLTQQQVAARGELNGQAEVGKVESGANKASSVRMRDGLAKGLGITRTFPWDGEGCGLGIGLFKKTAYTV